MWAGSILSIPAGWQLCNGSAGTPDLRNRFIVGAGQDGDNHMAGINGVGTGYYSPGNIGGQDLHQLSIAEMPSHNHPGGGPPPSGIYGYTGMQGGTNGWADHVNASGVTSIGNAGGDLPHENRPPYYALAYIMKL